MKTKHDGDCSIYSSLHNGNPEDGICICGYGFQYFTENGGDTLHLYSSELIEKIESKNKLTREEAEELLKNIFKDEIIP